MSKWVIRWILLIYLSTTSIFLGSLFAIWYNKSYSDLKNQKTINLKDSARNIILSIINNRFSPLKVSAESIAQSSLIKFAIFGNDEIIFSNLSFDIKNFNSNKKRGIYKNKAFLIAPLKSSSFYIGKKHDESKASLYVMIEGEDLSKELLYIRMKIAIYALGSLLILAFIAYFLVKIALKPLENKIKELNNFIKDSTHEINTPLSIILMSIERLEDKIQNKALNRMKIAAKTLSHVYSDLVFVSLPSEEKIKNLDIKNLIKERLEYFKLFIEQKNIKINLNLDQSYIKADKNAIIKIFDNIFNNAIKYNKINGFIDINLYNNTLIIKDSGCGINEENIKKIFNRYARFNTAQGGFGIGLNLVQKLCKKYNIKITCESKINIGSTFTLEW